MRLKKANGDMMQYFQDHPEKHESYLDRKEQDRKRRGKTAAALVEVANFGPELEGLLADVFKTAGLGTSGSVAKNVGRLTGMMSSNALAASGPASSAIAMNPRKGLVSAMNTMKPKRV